MNPEGVRVLRRDTPSPRRERNTRKNKHRNKRNLRRDLERAYNAVPEDQRRTIIID